MRKKFLLSFFCLVNLFLANNIHAQDDDKPKDAEGCADSPLVTRFPGFIIASCDKKEFEQADFPMGRDKDGNFLNKHLEGAYQTWGYNGRTGVSDLQEFRNFQSALKAAGFTIDYVGSPTDLVAHKGATWAYLETKGDYYNQTILTVKEMQQEVTADASGLSDEIQKTGHVAVYGIHFDTGKAIILPDSEQVLGEIVKMLQQNADLKLRVEGHTDNQGKPAVNQLLSEKRAQAVVAWLTTHGIAASRLTAKGLGQSQPVADNATDDGRAKNRRVELAKQ